MKRTLIGLIAFLIIMFPVRIYAEEWSELTGLLDDSLQLVKKEDKKAIQYCTISQSNFYQRRMKIIQK